MALVDGVRKGASKAIAKLGGNVTIRYVSNAAYNTTSGTVVENTTDITIKGVVQGVSNAEVNSLIEAEDKQLIVATADLATAPETKDRVVINSVEHQIISVNTVEQDNTAVTFELILRA